MAMLRFHQAIYQTVVHVERAFLHILAFC